MKKIVSAHKTMSRFSEFAKMSFFLYGRIIDKFNNSCAISIAVNQNIMKMALCSKNVYYACHIFWTSFGDLNFFVFLLLAYPKLQAWVRVRVRVRVRVGLGLGLRLGLVVILLWNTHDIGHDIRHEIQHDIRHALKNSTRSFQSFKSIPTDIVII